MKFETEEKILNFDLETNSKAMWFLEANQIECTYKSPIVMANELEGITTPILKSYFKTLEM